MSLMGVPVGRGRPPATVLHFPHPALARAPSVAHCRLRRDVASAPKSSATGRCVSLEAVVIPPSHVAGPSAKYTGAHFGEPPAKHSPSSRSRGQMSRLSAS